jgi:small subunit ribosomal protein S21
MFNRDRIFRPKKFHDAPEVRVYDDDINQAIRRLRRKVQLAGSFKALKLRERFPNRNDRRRWKHKRNLQRFRHAKKIKKNMKPKTKIFVKTEITRVCEDERVLSRGSLSSDWLRGEIRTKINLNSG